MTQSIDLNDWYLRSSIRIMELFSDYTNERIWMDL